MYRNLHAEISRAGLTQKGMAELINTSYNNFRNKIEGKRIWTLKEMLAIQDTLNKLLDTNLSLDYLFEAKE